MMRYLRRPGDPSAYEYPLQIPDAAQIMKRLHPQFFVFRVGDQDPAEPVRGDMLELTRTLPKIDSDEGRALMANDIKAQLLIKGVGKKKEKENPVAPA